MAQGTTNLIQKDTGDGTILILPWAYSAITQGTWVFSLSTVYSYSGMYYNSSNAVNDQIDYKVWLSKGSWTVAIEHSPRTSSGIVNILIDSVLCGGVDLYGAATEHAIVGVPQTINISTTGLKTLSLKLKCGISGASNAQVWLYHILLERAN